MSGYKTGNTYFLMTKKGNVFDEEKGKYILVELTKNGIILLNDLPKNWKALKPSNL